MDKKLPASQKDLSGKGHPKKSYFLGTPVCVEGLIKGLKIDIAKEMTDRFEKDKGPQKIERSFGVRVGIESVTAGTRLARPVTNDSGITLFGEGFVLDERSIERIMALGIDYIYVEGTPSTRRPLEEELKELEKRFNKVMDVPFMTTIKTAVKEYIISLYEDKRQADQG